MSTGQNPHIVIIGAGFGGLACAQALAGAPARVTIVDRHNYHLFVPLLYQVATAALSPADIARPIRRIVSGHRNIDVRLPEVVHVDTAKRCVRTTDDSAIDYDRLVIATGSEYSYFGHPEWARFAKGPRSLEDARDIRTRLLTAFERAEMTSEHAEQQALMTTIIVGGGPTGVEMAGSVAELSRHALARDFRRIDPRAARILLVEAGPRLLADFPPKLSDYAARALEKLGVTVITGKMVEDIDSEGATIGGEKHIAGTVIWGAGVKASSAGSWLGIELDKTGRIPVQPDLSVAGMEGVYCIGDSARFTAPGGGPLPALAQVAQQQGRHLGRAIAAQLKDGRALSAFRFSNRGNTAIVGRNAAVFDFGRLRIKGRVAWLLWAIVHIYLLVGFENRMRVAVQWVWRYITYERGARLIFGAAGENGKDLPPRPQRS